MNDIVKADNVLMLQLFHQRDFSYGCARRAFFAVEVDLFQRDELSSLTIPTLEDLAWLLVQHASVYRNERCRAYCSICTFS